MIYSDEFMDSLSTNTVEAGKLMCSVFFNFQEGVQYGGHAEDNYLDYLDAYIALGEFSISNNLIKEYAPLSVSGGKRDNINAIEAFFIQINEIIINMERDSVMETASNRYKTHFENSFSYKFTDVDLKRIQSLINKLRESIKDSSLFEENHKTRLLGKLEKLQSDLHMKMSSIDNIYGLMGEAGVVNDKIGENAKPFVDMINEILKIAWRTQSTAEKLPSSSIMPMLNV